MADRISRKQRAAECKKRCPTVNRDVITRRLFECNEDVEMRDVTTENVTKEVTNDVLMKDASVSSAGGSGLGGAPVAIPGPSMEPTLGTPKASRSGPVAIPGPCMEPIFGTPRSRKALTPKHLDMDVVMEEEPSTTPCSSKTANLKRKHQGKLNKSKNKVPKASTSKQSQ